jgi:hypothetical protein
MRCETCDMRLEVKNKKIIWYMIFVVNRISQIENRRKDA